jgi:hypothetical protein
VRSGCSTGGTAPTDASAAEGEPIVRLAIQERIARQNHTDRVRGAARRAVSENGEILDRLRDA